MRPEFKRLLKNTITVEKRTGQNRALEPEYAAGTSVPARIEPSIRQIQTADGEVVPLTTRVFLDNDVDVEQGDRITLPSGDAGVIEQLDTHYDETGAIHHFEIYLR